MSKHVGGIPSHVEAQIVECLKQTLLNPIIGAERCHYKPGNNDHMTFALFERTYTNAAGVAVHHVRLVRQGVFGNVKDGPKKEAPEVVATSDNVQEVLDKNLGTGEQIALKLIHMSTEIRAEAVATREAIAGLRNDIKGISALMYDMGRTLASTVGAQKDHSAKLTIVAEDWANKGREHSNDIMAVRKDLKFIAELLDHKYTKK